MRFNAFINRMFAYSVRQLALEFAADSKFAYRDQLLVISISSERGRSIDESLRYFANCCELWRIAAHCSDLNPTHESEL